MHVGPKEFARIIIASDGMWDMVTIEQVNEIAESVQSPHKLASKLATASFHQRLNENIRMDDITVVVIDINAALTADSIAGGGGCGCTVS